VSDRVYGTWTGLKTGLRHYASGVPQRQTLFHRKRGEWDTNLLCGPYVTNKPFVAANGVVETVTCLRCLYKVFKPRDPYSILRGQTYDHVVIDEAQDIDQKILEELTETMTPAAPGASRDLP
jgi:hypothetical protein